MSNIRNWLTLEAAVATFCVLVSASSPLASPARSAFAAPAPLATRLALDGVATPNDGATVASADTDTTAVMVAS
jgi:hypothetical protein